MEHQNMELEIDLFELLGYLKKKLWIIITSFLVCVTVSAVITVFFMEPEYTATTRMYVLNRSSEKAISSSDYSVSNYMVKDYEVLITGVNVTKKVVEQLDLDMAPETLAGKIHVEAIDDTRVLQIKVTDTNANRAAMIANCVREVASIQIKEIMDVDAVNLVYEATAPKGKSGPSLKRNVVLAAALGIVMSVGFLTVVFVLDDTIRTEEDVEKYLGVGTLSVIPASRELGLGNANGKKLRCAKNINSKAARAKK